MGKKYKLFISIIPEIIDLTGNQFDIKLAFKKGVEWEHKRLVEKACEWLRNNTDCYVETKYDEDFRVDIEQLSSVLRLL